MFSLAAVCRLFHCLFAIADHCNYSILLRCCGCLIVIPTVEELKKQLNLTPLFGESGYLSVNESSDHIIVDDSLTPSRSLPACSNIYYMLTPEANINYVHRMKCDDCHILLEGGPAHYYFFYENGTVEHVILGRDLQAGQKYMTLHRANAYKAIVLDKQVRHTLQNNKQHVYTKSCALYFSNFYMRLTTFNLLRVCFVSFLCVLKAPYLLVANVLSPGWTPDRCEIGVQNLDEFVEKYKNKADWCTEEFLRSLQPPTGPVQAHADQ